MNRALNRGPALAALLAAAALLHSWGFAFWPCVMAFVAALCAAVWSLES